MRSLEDRLRDVLDAIQRIEEAAVRGRDAFLADAYLQVWMVHHIQLIGEAVRAVSDELKALRPEMPWAQIVAMRHILVHQYFGVELDDVWAVVERDLPELKSTVESMLADLEGGTAAAPEQ
jgi:uncharacterized protein with HEPN domain